MRWAGHVACMGERKGVYKVMVGKPNGERGHLEDPSEDGRIILRWIFRKWDGGHVAHRFGSGQGQVAGTCRCRNEPLGSI